MLLWFPGSLRSTFRNVASTFHEIIPPPPTGLPAKHTFCPSINNAVAIPRIYKTDNRTCLGFRPILRSTVHGRLIPLGKEFLDFPRKFTPHTCLWLYYVILEDSRLLGCYAVLTNKQLSKFRRILLLLSSRSRRPRRFDKAEHPVTLES